MKLYQVQILQNSQISHENWLLTDNSAWQAHAHANQVVVIKIKPIKIKDSKPNYQHELHNLFQMLAAQTKLKIPLLVTLSQYVKFDNKYSRLWLGFHLSQHLEQGKSIAEAFQSCQLDKLFAIQVMKTCQGENAMEKGFTLIAQAIEFDNKLIDTLTQATRYPKLLALFGGIIIWAVSFFLVPSFATFYSAQNADLPAVTATLFKLATALHEIYFYVWCGGILGMIWVLKRPIKTMILNSVFHTIHKNIELIRVAQILHVSTQAGMTIQNSLSMVKQMLVHSKLQKGMQKVIENIASGYPVISALSNNADFPVFWKDVLASTKSAENLSTAWSYIVTRQDQLTQEQLKKITMFIEPVAIAVVGSITGGMLLMLYTPIFQIGQSI